MKKQVLFISVIIFLIFPTYGFETAAKTKKSTSKTIASFSEYSAILYNELGDKELKFETFETALKGYLNLQTLKKIDNDKLLTVIDFSKSSSKNRFFVIDIQAKKIIYKSLVAHGKNSGYEFATNFSNKVSSHKSSLGFYKTAETYSGKHGYSLRLDGLEYSNNNARSRAIVIHGAEYVSKDFIKKNGKLGRSFGCPSLPTSMSKEIIQKIKDGTCLFIYSEKTTYLSKSKLVNSPTRELAIATN